MLTATRLGADKQPYLEPGGAPEPDPELQTPPSVTLPPATTSTEDNWFTRLFKQHPSTESDNTKWILLGLGITGFAVTIYLLSGGSERVKK